jgi:hypothetical protein
VIGLALNVGACRWVRPKDLVTDRQPHEGKEAADAIDRSPPETAGCFERGVRDFADNLRSPWLSREKSPVLPKSPPASRQSSRSGFIVTVLPT